MGVHGHSWHGDRIVIAVGCRAAQLPVPGGELALTYRDILTLKTLPHEVAVIGGADTGCQIASIFASLGTDVRLQRPCARAIWPALGRNHH